MSRQFFFLWTGNREVKNENRHWSLCNLFSRRARFSGLISPSCARLELFPAMEPTGVERETEKGRSACGERVYLAREYELGTHYIHELSKCCGKP